MFFKIDPNNGVAIYEQIVRQVKYAVANGALRSGELVPSVRELAMMLAVNPNTVAKAYRDLQNDSVLESMRGEGLRVSKQATEKCRKERHRLLLERIKAVVTEGQQSGYAERDFFALVREAWQTLQQSGEVQTQRVSQPT